MKIDSGLMGSDLRVGAPAKHAEELGYDGLWTAEAGHDPYLPAAIAATATERVSIGTNIAVAFPRSLCRRGDVRRHPRPLEEEVHGHPRPARLLHRHAAR